MGEALLMNRSQEWKPEYTYTNGTCTYTDEGNGNWNIKFLTSGTGGGKLTFIQPNSARRGIDIFLVGGGGGGANSYDITNYGARAGGGGGYTATYTNVKITRRTEYTIIIGAGGAKADRNSSGSGNAKGADGGQTSAFNKTVNGGKGGWAEYGNDWRATGGNGGSGGAAHSQQYPSQWTQVGGTNGGNGEGYTSRATGGTGQGNPPGTKEFGNGTTVYSQGGGKGTSTIANTGNGGNYNANGSSGIVIIRNTRSG